MVRLGVDREGVRHRIALREGCRESAESWGELIRDCRRRGLNEPACWIADGALGLWAAIDAHSPNSAQQRCTNHKTRNVLDKLPKAEQPETLRRLRAIWYAQDETTARRRARELIRDLRRALDTQRPAQPARRSATPVAPRPRCVSRAGRLRARRGVSGR